MPIYRLAARGLSIWIFALSVVPAALAASSVDPWGPDDALFTFTQTDSVPEVEVQEPGTLEIGDTAPPETSLVDESLTLVYEPATLDGAPIPGLTVDRLKAEILARSGSSPAVSATTVVIPTAPRETADLEPLAGLDEAELAVFLSKKQRYLEMLAQKLSSARFPAKWINSVLVGMNQQMFKSAPVVARSNAFGLNLEVTVNGGLGLRTRFVEALRRAPWGRFLPASGGFFFSTSLGFTILKVNIDGEEKLILQVANENKSLKTVSSLVAGLGVDFAVGGVVKIENLDETSRTLDTSAMYGGAHGVLRRGSQHYAADVSFGVGLPPLASVFYVYELDGKRHTLANLDMGRLKPREMASSLKRLRGSMAQRVRQTFRRGSLTCGDLFSPTAAAE